MINYETLRPLIFRMQPEQAHRVTVGLLRLAGALPPAAWLLRTWYRPDGPVAPVRALGLTFPNPVGLAAGYDKDGLAWRGLAALGFGHVEVGTVTPRPQPGNPGPRIFRLPEERGIINRMGFPSEGGAVVARRLAGPRPRHFVLGVNIGKNKATALEDAAEDYLALLQTFAPLADYLAINISSPNTPGLRSLQSRAALEALLAPLAAERTRQVRKLGHHLPLLVKLAPDLSSAELDDALEAIAGAGMDGVIVSNTTIGRQGVRSAVAAETGGLSGEPLRRQSTEFVRAVARRTRGRLPIIASGGVMTGEHVNEKLDAGATLVQLYSGLIYAGPGLVRDAVNASAAEPRGLALPAPRGVQPAFGHSSGEPAGSPVKTG